MSEFQQKEEPEIRSLHMLLPLSDVRLLCHRVGLRMLFCHDSMVMSVQAVVNMLVL